MAHQVSNFRDRNPTKKSFPAVTMGTVVDTDDPQEMGRLRVLCPALNDIELENITAEDLERIPWASYMSPFGGASNSLVRGPNKDPSIGNTAYGFWGIPTAGAQALVVCIDGDPQLRVWIGCIHTHLTPHTLPHGRFFGLKNSIDGPGTSTERPLGRLRTNFKEAFGSLYEFISRAADYTVAALKDDVVEDSESARSDDKHKAITLPNGTVIEYNQGYAREKRDVTSLSSSESQTYAWVSPGFHAISMDDRFENCRVRIRTTTGHQILLDDTNERILLNTNRGKSYIELDSNGNVDIYSERHLSFHSVKDMSFTSDGIVRIRGQQGIHLLSGGDIRVSSGADINFQSVNLRSSSSAATYVQSGTDLHIKAGNVLNIDAVNSNLKASSNVNIQAGVTANISASTSILQTSSTIHINGPAAAPATSASASSSNFAYSSNRVPFRKNADGVPWSRGMLKSSSTDLDDTLNLIDFYDYTNHEFVYESDQVGKVELGEPIERNSYWRR